MTTEQEFTTEEEFDALISDMRAFKQKQKMTTLSNLYDSLEMFFKMVKYEEENGPGSSGVACGVAYWQKSVEFWINYYNK